MLMVMMNLLLLAITLWWVALTLTPEAANELNVVSSSSKKLLVSIQCDVTSDKDVAAMRSQVEHYLEQENAVLHTLVNNAGIADPGDFAWFSDLKTHRSVMEVNFFGALRVTQALLPLMLRTSRNVHDGARILNLSSVCGTSASPSNSAYSASKFAIEAWSDSLRIELEPFAVQVVKVRPGQVGTQIQQDWADNLLRNYGNAPAQVRELYGSEEYSKAVQKAFAGMNGSALPQPQTVVDALADMIAMDPSKLQPYYWIGADAHTFWRALHTLPTTVADSIKQGMLHFRPVQQPLPPVGILSHVAIKVRDLQKSLKFYEDLGFTPLGEAVNGQVFLQPGTSRKKNSWATLILLVEDHRMPTRGKSSDAGMTRLCLYSRNIDAELKRLSALGVEPMAPPAQDKMIKLAAYQDPTVLSFITFKSRV